uniref:Uncharacterized protein n=1 Tax=Parascaris univalens TaxID=6257 RepID=A0A915C5H0_PARUN
MGLFFLIRTAGLLMMLTGAALLCYIPYETLYRKILRLREITQLDFSICDFIMFALLPKTYQKCQLSYWSVWSECERGNATTTRYRLIPFGKCHKQTDIKPCRCPPSRSKKFNFIDFGCIGVITVTFLALVVCRCIILTLPNKKAVEEIEMNLF